tara:strand:+ start:2325 stop:2996 length:672 start_codon:yes stop_codon:yes gene_type:complete
MTDEQLRSRIEELAENGQWNCCYKFPNNINTRTYHVDSPGYNLNKWKRLEPLLDNINLTGKTVIDIGCGDGYYAIQCAKKEAKYVLGIDIDSLRIKRGILAKEVFNLNNVNFKCIDLYNDSIKEFDIVMGLGLLHRLPDIEKCLQKMSLIASTIVLEFKGTQDSKNLQLNQQAKHNKYNKLYSIPSIEYIKQVLKKYNYNTFKTCLDTTSNLRFKRHIIVGTK